MKARRNGSIWIFWLQMAAGTWQNLNIGWTNYGGSDVDIEEWIDDLALGDAPIPCPAAP